jgi:hypothetical protein
MKLFDPTDGPRAPVVQRAPRPAALAGLRVALVDNTKFNSDALLGEVAERLARRYGTRVVARHRKRSPSHELEDTAADALAGCADLVIAGIGD